MKRTCSVLLIAALLLTLLATGVCAETYHAGFTFRTNPDGTITITVPEDSKLIGSELHFPYSGNVNIAQVSHNGSNIDVQPDPENHTIRFTITDNGDYVISPKHDDSADSSLGDVSSDSYYYDAVLWALKNGITSGAGDALFLPNAGCTRAQIVTFLWRAIGSPTADGIDNPFRDVSANAYYYDAVRWAVSSGLVQGMTPTEFAPDKLCTRGQIVTLLHRYDGSPAVIGANPFRDVAAGSYCERAVVWAVQQGITEGTSATTFAPNATCTRGQIVTFLYRYFNR